MSNYVEKKTNFYQESQVYCIFVYKLYYVFVG